MHEKLLEFLYLKLDLKDFLIAKELLHDIIEEVEFKAFQQGQDNVIEAMNIPER